MKKVAIVGVEGSGKTVMLAGLGELYSRPDQDGYFLMPKNFSTAAYVSNIVRRMRGGEWPTATAEDVLQGLDWTLKRRQQGGRPETICEISCLDFAGEVYRSAFGIRSEDGTVASDEVKALKDYIREADDLIVLINLRDVITRGIDDPRVQEAMWITNSILSVALDETGDRPPPLAMIALSQADSYAETIMACGGAKGVLEQYLPYVANNYDWLDMVSVSAVDRTMVDDEGNVVPAPDFTPGGLRPLLAWILNGEAPVSVSGGVRSAVFASPSNEPHAGDTKMITLPGGATMEFVWCPATTSAEWKRISGGDDFFWMGSPNEEKGRSEDEIRHRVMLTQGFWMGKYEVTQAQWKSVMGNNPSEFTGDNRPVEYVSWDDCQEFIRKVNAAGGVTVALPTEAQWEYACRAGTTGPYAGELDEMAWYAEYLETHDVGTKKPNAWGVYDMHGNVWEWCADWCGAYVGDATDPTGPASGSYRVLRGGSWYGGARNCRSAYRNYIGPSNYGNYFGFRLVCSAAGPRR